MTDQQALSRVLREFARTMAGNYDIAEALHDLSDRVVEILHATAAGVALFDRDVLRFVTATSDAAAAAERIQEELQSGPCLASIERNEPVAVPDLCAERERWPEYVPAVERVGFRSMLGIPLVLDDRRVGSLDVYSEAPREWDEEAVNAAVVLADIGAAYVLNATELVSSQRAAEQLQAALDSRVVIEQAKGVLSERLGISTSDAFQRIRASARRQSTKVGEVCRRVIDTDHVPD
jgi:signal transduction protein with GAF and PtsI domain